jgi:amino acid permease
MRTRKSNKKTQAGSLVMQPKGGGLASRLSTLATLSRYGGHIVGVGILGVPFAVSQAGIVASAVCIITFCSLSLLTCLWLLEVGDRANAIQNELTRSFGTRPSFEVVVQHAGGHRSRLQPAIAFGRGAAPPATGLREPLLGGEAEEAAPHPDWLHQSSRPASHAAVNGASARRSDGEQRLDDYRAAYRSWRQGGHAGARDSELRKLRPLLVYESSVHRKLLPLQLVPPPRRRRDSGTTRSGAGRAAAGCHGQGCNVPRGLSSVASVANGEGGSSLSLDGVLVLPGGGLSRTGSFSVDLKEALERSRRPSPRTECRGEADASQPGEACEREGGVERSGLLEGCNSPPLLNTWSIPRLGELFPDSYPPSPAVFRARSDIQHWHSPDRTPQPATPDSAHACSPMTSARRLLPASLASTAVPAGAGVTGVHAGAETGHGIVCTAGDAIGGDLDAGISGEAGGEGGGGGAAGHGASAGGNCSERGGSHSAVGLRGLCEPIQAVRSLDLKPASRTSNHPPAVARAGGRFLAPPPVPPAPDWSVPAISSLEVAQLCTLFLGWRARAIWIASVCLLHVCGMWACAAIWMQAVQAAMDPARRSGEPVPPPLVLMCAAAVLIPASAVGGLARLQPALSAATAATAALMIGFLAAALAVQNGSTPAWLVFDLPRRPPPPRPAPLRLLLDPAHLAATSAVLAFCHTIQQSVPALRRAPGGAAAARSALRLALCGYGLLYLLLSCLTALVFGDETLPVVNLLFYFLRCAPAHTAAPLWASIVGRAIALMPILSATAAFPLFNGVLASNLAVVLPTRLASRRMTAPACALPPLLGAAVLADTPTLLALCGLPCLVIALLIPAALQAAALRASLLRWGEAGRRTPHSTRLSGHAPALAVFVVCALFLAAGIWSLLLMPLLHALGAVPGGHTH